MKKIKKPYKIAVLVMAVCISAALLSWWLVTLYCTVNSVGMCDYEGDYAMRLIGSHPEDAKNLDIYGVQINADDENFAEKAKQIIYSGKVAFVFVDRIDDPKKFFQTCFSVASRRNFVICAHKSSVLEKFYQEDKGYCYLLLTDGKVGWWFGNEMGYNCALPAKDIESKRITKAHEEGHLIAVTGVSREKAKELQSLFIDFVFLDAE